MSSHVEGATRRAVSCFDRYSERLLRVYGLKGESFDDTLVAKRRMIEPIYPQSEAGRGVGVFPHRRAFGMMLRLQIGTFGLYLTRLEPWEEPFELVATVALGEHQTFTQSALVTSLVDPERRIGLGPWYEVTANFEGVQPDWDHGFYAYAQDPRRRRLDHIWRRHRVLADRAPDRLRGDVLFTGMWERILSRASF